jgi:hypothetical protein
LEQEERELFLASPTLKYLLINRALLTRDDGQVLWGLMGEEESESRKLVVPHELREHVLRLRHYIPATGHQQNQGPSEVEVFFGMG